MAQTVGKISESLHACGGGRVFNRDYPKHGFAISSSLDGSIKIKTVATNAISACEGPQSFPSPSPEKADRTCCKSRAILFVTKSSSISLFLCLARQQIEKLPSGVKAE